MVNVELDIIDTLLKYLSSQIQNQQSCGTTDNRAILTLNLVGYDGSQNQVTLTTCNSSLVCNYTTKRYVCTGQFTSPLNGYVYTISGVWRVFNNSINAMELYMILSQTDFVVSIGNNYYITISFTPTIG